MGFVTMAFGFGDGQNALIDPGREQVWYRGDDGGIDGSLNSQFILVKIPIPSHQVFGGLADGRWDWGGVIRRKANPMPSINLLWLSA